jgi:hypothetical protein
MWHRVLTRVSEALGGDLLLQVMRDALGVNFERIPAPGNIADYRALSQRVWGLVQRCLQADDPCFTQGSFQANWRLDVIHAAINQLGGSRPCASYLQCGGVLPCTVTWCTVFASFCTNEAISILMIAIVPPARDVYQVQTCGGVWYDMHTLRPVWAQYAAEVELGDDADEDDDEDGGAGTGTGPDAGAREEVQRHRRLRSSDAALASALAEGIVPVTLFADDHPPGAGQRSVRVPLLSLAPTSDGDDLPLDCLGGRHGVTLVCLREELFRACRLPDAGVRLDPVPVPEPPAPMRTAPNAARFDPPTEEDVDASSPTDHDRWFAAALEQLEAQARNTVYRSSPLYRPVRNVLPVKSFESLTEGPKTFYQELELVRVVARLELSAPLIGRGVRGSYPLLLLFCSNVRVEVWTKQRPGATDRAPGNAVDAGRPQAGFCGPANGRTPFRAWGSRRGSAHSAQPGLYGRLGAATFPGAYFCLPPKGQLGTRAVF